TSDAKLMVDGKILPFTFDFMMGFYASGGTQTYVRLDSTVTVEKTLDPTNNTYLLEVDLPEYSNIFQIVSATRMNMSNLELLEDMRMIHGFSYSDLSQYVIIFNMETEEGNKAFGVVNKVIKELKIQLKLQELEWDFKNDENNV
ncbi:MAG: hypothetical protein J6T74_00125, partial [Clostridia bacterium]|nr:hypothetical protein [Clostridia bacterium]